MRATILVLLVAVVGGLGRPAAAELCEKCRNGVYIQSLGRCQSCGEATGSGAFKICPKCSAEKNRCEHCLARLNGPKRPPNAKTPKRPQPIQPGKPGTYTAGRWKYRLEVAAAGSHQKRGRLLLDDVEMADPKLNDYLLTPWGPVVWVGLEQNTRRRGWMFVPIPTAKRKGKLLPTPGDQTQLIGLTQADSGTTVSAILKTVVVICLPGNATTGYRWQIADTGSGALKQLGQDEYFARPRPPRWAGGGGTFVFKFQAVNSATANVKLVYVRPWEKNKAPAKTFTVTIKVRSKRQDDPRSGSRARRLGAMR